MLLFLFPGTCGGVFLPSASEVHARVGVTSKRRALQRACALVSAASLGLSVRMRVQSLDGFGCTAFGEQRHRTEWCGVVGVEGKSV